VGFTEWMLALHLLAVFAAGAAFVLFTVLVVGGRRMTSLDDARLLFRVGALGGVLVGVGVGLALVFGVILAFDEYEIWDGWIIAAIVLWVILGGLGRQTGDYYTETRKLAESGSSEAEVFARLHASKGPILLLLLDMLFKPGA
jgi:hypothetical protein